MCMLRDETGEYNTIDFHGDRLANKANHNRRHHSTNTAWYDAVAAIAHTSTILGDKDDTSGRTKQFNDGHVPDLVEVNGGSTGEDVINEIKVYTDLKKANTKGCATRAGASFRCDGHRFAFGNSEDKVRVECTHAHTHTHHREEAQRASTAQRKHMSHHLTVHRTCPLN